MGYHRAGFDVVGVDIRPQPNYPFEFVEDDALGVLAELSMYRSEYDAIHASPPCQAYSMYSRNLGVAHKHPDYIAEVRSLLLATALPYVIENVKGSPLLNPVVLCATQFGLGTGEMELHRHRLFELNWDMGCLVAPCSRRKRLSIGVYGHGTPQWHRQMLGRNVLAAEWREAMGIDWMTKDELAEAIPPAYTELIGHQLLQHLKAVAA
jgi:DNA (cytosine-5)-methyltransferase 1